MMEKTQLDNIFYMIASVLLIWFFLELFSIQVSFLYMLPSILEWITQFILPWLILYCLVRLIYIKEQG